MKKLSSCHISSLTVWFFLQYFRLGLEPKLLAKILNTSSGRCWSSEVYNPCPGVLDGVPSSNNYYGGFGTALMTKVRNKYSHILHTYWKEKKNCYIIKVSLNGQSSL